MQYGISYTKQSPTAETVGDSQLETAPDGFGSGEEVCYEAAV